MASKSKSGKVGKIVSGAVTKGEVITVRLSPKLKYGLELLSRTQHRTQSAVVTWAIEQMMTSHEAGLFKNVGKSLTKSLDQRLTVAEPKQMLDVLWDVDPADRLVKLAIHWPELMTYEEEKLVKIIKKGGWGWPKSGDSATERMRQALPEVIKKQLFS